MNLRPSLELKKDINQQNQKGGNIFNSQKLSSTKQPQLATQENKEMHLLPSTSKYYKRTYRHFFKRRMNQMERPLIVITF